MSNFTFSSEEKFDALIESKKVKPKKTPRNISYHLPTAIKIALIWTTIALLQALYEYAILKYYGVTPEMKSYLTIVQSMAIMVFLAGILVGLFLIPRVNNWLRTHSYGLALLLIMLSTTVLYFILSSLGSFIYNALYFDLSLFDPSIPPIVRDYIFGIENIKNYFFWLVIATFTILAIQINDKYGPGIFYSFLMGKYFHPKAEERIFMFLDIRSSTTIAEQLEELQYFEFIKEFIQDVTPGILNSKGEIYQYVGDEIVVSWPFQKGLEHNNCITAFFEIQDIIKAQSDKYLKKYGLVPSFKVGLHGGKVISGEIGLIKRDIAFSGDILNTAARIQAKCNELGVDLLISENLFLQLRQSNNNYSSRSIGEVDLKGKAKALKLYTFESKK